MLVVGMYGDTVPDEWRNGPFEWSMISHAVWELNGADRDTLGVQIGTDHQMTVCGGPDRFVVCVQTPTGWLALKNPGAPAGTVRLRAGGQMGVYDLTELVDRDTALRAVWHYARTGECDPSLNW